MSVASENQSTTNTESHRRMDESKVETLEVLLDHFNSTGSPFIYLNFIEDLHLDYSDQTLQEAFRKLRQDNVIYLWQDRGIKALKLGLKKAFIEKLLHLQTDYSGGKVSLDSAR